MCTQLHNELAFYVNARLDKSSKPVAADDGSTGATHLAVR